MKVNLKLPGFNMQDLSLKRYASKAGKLPGTVEYTGDHIIPTTVRHMAYNADSFNDVLHDEIDGWIEQIETDKVHWLDIVGLSDAQAIQNLGTAFEIHPLLLEDVVNIDQMPKTEDFENHYYIALKMMHINKEGGVEQKHISLVLGPHYVMSFQEKPGDVFNELRYRITNKIGKIRMRGADYLFSQLIDTIVDQYFAVFEDTRTDIEKLEFKMLANRRTDFTDEVISIRKEIIQLRKWVMPLREAITKIRRSESKLIKKEWKHYLEDTSDQLEHVIQFFDQFRDMLNYLMDLNFANLANETNEIVKTLTIISAIFIPLTFIAGLYGMNFKYMPELYWEDGYYYVLTLMGIIFIASVIAMKRRHWW
ncbi:magnesium/cobalt transporter CorA [bacterium]|nr:magnesium/cobalt transporter CorA [bacterium]